MSTLQWFAALIAILLFCAITATAQTLFVRGFLTWWQSFAVDLGFVVSMIIVGILIAYALGLQAPR